MAKRILYIITAILLLVLIFSFCLFLSDKIFSGFFPAQLTGGGIVVGGGGLGGCLALPKISVTVGPNGSASSTPGMVWNALFNYYVIVQNIGGNVSIAFTPNSGYVINDVVIDSGTPNQINAGSVSSYNFTSLPCNSQHTVAVTFAQQIINHTITLSVGSNGSASPSDETSQVVDGSNATITFTPNSGYEIQDVIDNGTSVKSSLVSNALFLNNITTDHAIAATFIPTTKTITLSVGSNGSADPAGPIIQADYGSNATITFTPNSGYEIQDVIDNGTSVKNSLLNNAFTLSNIITDHAIAVTFSRVAQSSVSGGGGSVYTPTTTSSASSSSSSSSSQSSTSSIAKTTDTTETPPVKEVSKNDKDNTSGQSPAQVQETIVYADKILNQLKQLLSTNFGKTKPTNLPSENLQPTQPPTTENINESSNYAERIDIYQKIINVVTNLIDLIASH